MKTVIFIIALTVMAAPVWAAQGDAITCTGSAAATLNCNMCIEGPISDSTDQCFDCRGGYYLSSSTATTGVCTSCPNGKTSSWGSASSGTLMTMRPFSQTITGCFPCGSGCSECLQPTQASAMTGLCAKCKPGYFASVRSTNPFSAVGGYCGGICTGGTTRDSPDAVITALETEAVCTGRCDPSCIECRGTSATALCYRCAAGYYLAYKNNPLDEFGFCTRCTGGKGKDADYSQISSTTPATTSAACYATCTPSSRCGTCSASRPSECISCEGGLILSSITKTCIGLSVFAALVTLSLGISMIAYVLF